MKRELFSLTLFLAASALSHAALTAESDPVTAPGIELLQLLTDVETLVPGKPITVALLIKPAPGHHTYWRGPGIVGVATSLEWTLPEGFEAGAMLWPVPEKVDMVGIAANGYKRETLLLTEIRVPEQIDGSLVEFRVKTAWMACATSCNPGVAELSLSLPVHTGKAPGERDEALAKKFASLRAAAPPAPPGNWSLQVARPAEESIVMTLSVPALTKAQTRSLEFFCDDMQVNSDEPITVEWLDEKTGTFRLKFIRPSFAPRSPAVFSGLLKNSTAWPGLNHEWVSISIPWPGETDADE